MSSRKIDPVTAYAQRVLDGKIVAGPHVRAACQRHLNDRERGPRRGLVWDEEACNHALGFFPAVLRLAGGQFEGRKFELQQSQQFIIGSIFGWKLQDGTRRFRRAYIEEGKGNGKALALDTPIPTPGGWTTMGQVQPGDHVLDERGRPNLVTAATEVMRDHRCFAVEFDDGEIIVADADHLWSTEQRVATAQGERRATFGVPKSEWGRWRQGLRTTAEIAATLRYRNGQYRSANHSIALAAPLDLAEAELPVDPFVLGVWLGDGDSDCARVTCADNDDQTIENLLAAGCSVGPRRGGKERAGRYRIGSVPGASLNATLRRQGLFRNKHIPSTYLRASFLQRLSLLQGLMDTDGSISASSGQCEFTTTSERLAVGFRELAHTLGLKTGYSEGQAKLEGRVVGPKWRVTFHPPADLPIFRLSRKRAHQIARHNRRRLAGDRRIVDCRPVPSVPVRCISVASSSRLYLAGRAMVPTHNSPLLAGIGLYCMLADNEPRAEIYAAASKKEQAQVLFRDAVAMRQQAPHLLKRLTPSGVKEVWNLADVRTGSFFRPIASDEGQSGPRPSCALCDEIHEHRDGNVLEMLERGFKWRRQPLLVMATNSGSDRNSVCWEEHQFAIRAAAEQLDHDKTDPAFSYVCALDENDDPFVDPKCWVKANPLLGVTITKEYLAGVVGQAQAIPGKLNNILRLHFCVWTDAERAWMPRETIEQCIVYPDDDDDAETALFKFTRPLVGKEVNVGLDLSSTQDLTAMAFAVKTGETTVERTLPDGSTKLLRAPTVDAWIQAWTPGDSLMERAIRDGAHYDVWERQGWLQAPKGSNIRYDYPAVHLAEVSTRFKIRLLAYDRYAYRKFEDELDAIGLDFPTLEHPQAGQKRGAISPELAAMFKRRREEVPQGLWMPGSIIELENMIFEKRIRLLGNPVLISAMNAVVFDQSALGNRWFSKRRATGRIDAAVALAMAVGAATMTVAAKPNIRSFLENPVIA